MTENETPTASPSDLLDTLSHCAHLALTATEQERAVEANEHVDAIERLVRAYRTAAQPEWATELEQLRADCARKDHEYATCERLLREAYDENARIRHKAAALTMLCAECGHAKSTHDGGDDPVSPGRCTACPDDDAWHDYDPADEAQQAECAASISSNCLRESEGDTACDTGATECVHGGRPADEAQQTQEPS